MSRRIRSLSSFEAVQVEGGLLGAEWLARVAALEAGAQSAEDHGVPRGLQLRDEIARAWRVAQSAWFDLAAARREQADAGAATRAFVQRLLRDVLGFTELADGGSHTVAERVFPLAHVARRGAVPIVIAPHDLALDAADARFAEGGRRRSAHGLLPECLNADDAQLWGVVTNGLRWRMVRDHVALTRPAYLEADLVFGVK